MALHLPVMVIVGSIVAPQGQANRSAGETPRVQRERR
jgi:hypothetical protein